MELKVYRALLALLLLTGFAYYFLFYNAKPDETTHQESTIPVALEGRVFHWRYDIGWDFRIEMTKEEVYWEGVGGFFDGVAATVSPHYTPISDDIYFVTWRIPFIGVDSLVLDLGNQKVFAHVKANNRFYAVAGEIYCDSEIADCEAPVRQ